MQDQISSLFHCHNCNILFFNSQRGRITAQLHLLHTLICTLLLINCNVINLNLQCTRLSRHFSIKEQTSAKTFNLEVHLSILEKHFKLFQLKPILLFIKEQFWMKSSILELYLLLLEKLMMKKVAISVARELLISTIVLQVSKKRKSTTNHGQQVSILPQMFQQILHLEVR